MTYAALQDLIDRAGDDELRQTADRDGDGIADPEVIAAALTHADNTINGYVESRYGALTSVPDLVRTWAVSIARYMLFRHGAPDYVAQDYRDAIAALKSVSRGEMALPVAAGQDAPASQSGQVMASHPAPVFTPTKLRGW